MGYYDVSLLKSVSSTRTVLSN